jgi:hypothetical protein
VTTKLEGLAIRHAELSAEIKTNKDQMAIELGYCNGGEFVKSEIDSGQDFSFLTISPTISGMGLGTTCLNYSYEAFADMNANNDDHYSYDEVLSNFGCRHCNSARNLKKHIGKLKSEKGRIHSAFTNIGKSIMHLTDKG